MQKLTRDEVLKQGFGDFRVRVYGIIQSHRFTVVREQTPFGPVPYLVAKAAIPQMELVRLAEEIQLPVTSAGATAMPRGKMAKDFAGL